MIKDISDAIELLNTAKTACVKTKTPVEVIEDFKTAPGQLASYLNDRHSAMFGIKLAEMSQIFKLMNVSDKDHPKYVTHESRVVVMRLDEYEQLCALLEKMEQEHD